MSLTYEQSGVDYGPLDAFKRACQQQALATTASLVSHNITEPAGVRGESEYFFQRKLRQDRTNETELHALLLNVGGSRGTSH